MFADDITADLPPDLQGIDNNYPPELQAAMQDIYIPPDEAQYEAQVITESTTTDYTKYILWGLAGLMGLIIITRR